MRIYKLLNKTKALIAWTSVCLILATLLIFPVECRNGGSNGMYLCIQVLIPSLFPFMVLSGFIIKSGLYLKIPKSIAKPFSRLFGLSESCAIITFLTLIGGYPVGATSISAMKKEGSLNNKECEQLAMFCVCSGPGFLVTYIGSVMTRNLKLGYILYLSQIISVFILGFIARFTTSQKIVQTHYINPENPLKLKEGLVFSVDSAIIACSKICALIVIFSAVTEVFCTLLNSSPYFMCLTALIEITNGTKILADGYPTYILAFACGFGGICVHMQIFSSLKGIKYSKVNFYIFRILQGFICSFLSFILIRIFPITKSVFSTISEAKPVLYTTSVGCIFLILTCIAFILCTHNKSNRPN